ncbi:MAG TPA: neutral zinc metallopeptidase [Gaiellaceae bacterium]|nr:neutral zinc metallopeptidase [Gaiellaceae bacterium]
MRFRKDARLDRSQVEDYRGRRMGGGAPMALGGGGIVTVLIVLAVVLLGGNLGGGGGGLGGLGDLAGQSAGTAAPGTTLDHCQSGQDANEHEDCFVLGVVNSVQGYWSKALRNYEPATTRFFDGSISTGCGTASSAVGPFYCPADRHVYIDLGFFDQLESFGGSSAPLARAYVLAHEYGHHVQNLTGTLQRASGGDTGPQSNGVRVELQADCYAGAWVANAMRAGLIEDITRADVQDALTSAAAIGDDRIQEKTQGQVNPETWTHGSSDQRQSWFVRGMDGGSPNSCDTFRGRV